MISSFFGKTEPIGHIILPVFLVLFSTLYTLHAQSWEGNYLMESLAISALVLELFIINEMAVREKVPAPSSYTMLFFVLLLVAFPSAFLDKNGVFSNIFILLALWRLLGIRTLKNIKHKIFDASFFICTASFFHDWTLLFLILVFLVINVYDGKNMKNWIVPLVAVAATAILAFVVGQVSGNPSFFLDRYNFSVDFLGEFPTMAKNTKLLGYVFVIFASTTLVFLKLRKISGGKLVVLRILFFAFVLSSALNFFKMKSADPMILGFFPASVFLANYLETIRKNWVKRIVFVVFLIASFFILALEISS